MSDAVSRRSELMARMAATQTRVDTLKEVIAFHRQIRPAESDDWETTARGFANAYLALGAWFTEALHETLIEGELALTEMQAIQAEIGES